MKKYIYIAVAALVPLGLLSWPFFVRVNIFCKTQYGACSQPLGAQVYSHNGENLIKAGRGIAKSLKSNFLVSDFSLQFKLPNILLADLLIKKPETALLNKYSGEVALVDSSGIVLTYEKETNLPKVEITDALPKPGEKVSDDEMSALKIIAGVFDMYQVSNAEISEKSLVIDLPGQIRVLFPLGGDSQVLLGALRLIYAKVTSSELAGKYSQIDLRFKNPVLR